MRITTLAALALLCATVSAHAAELDDCKALMADPAKNGFSQRKAFFLAGTGNQIQLLQAMSACVSKATTQDAADGCQASMKASSDKFALARQAEREKLIAAFPKAYACHNLVEQAKQPRRDVTPPATPVKK